MDSPPAKQNRETGRMAIDGYAVIDELLQADEIARVDESLHGTDAEAAGDRRFLDREWCRLLAHVIRHRLLKRRLLYRASRPVLCTYFRDGARANGSHDLHRELHVPLAARRDGPQFSDWTEKQGIVHARATRELLATMLAVRVYVDDCASGADGLCVVPGSHTGADVDAERISCGVARGGAIVFSPLLLHGAPAATSPRGLRVLQFLFGPDDPPDGARWYY